MAKRKARSTASRRAYYPPRKKAKRRTSTLNRSTVPTMKSAGALIGAGITYGPYAMASIKARSVSPMVGAITNKDVALDGIKHVAIGYLAGGVAGKVIDVAGLKKPVNKAIRSVKRLI